MPWTRSKKTVSKGNSSVPHNKAVFGEPKMVQLYRVLKEGLERTNNRLDGMGDYFDMMGNHIDSTKEAIKIKTDQRLAKLQLQG